MDADDPGLHVKLTYDLNENIGKRFLLGRPRIAILREQGVNGQVEMAAAFDRAGFATVDVHMSDIISGRVKLADFKGFAACGVRVRAGLNPSCSTRVRATSLPPSSSAATPSHWACATVAR